MTAGLNVLLGLVIGVVASSALWFYFFVWRDQ